jgi:hypothetical protein
MVSPLWVRAVVSVSTLLHQADHKGHHGHDDEYKEKDLCDFHSTSGNASKPEDGGDQCDDEKDNCVVQHTFISLRVRQAIRLAVL